MSRLLLSISMLLCWTMVSGQLTAPFTESFDTQGVPSGWTNTNISGSTSTDALWDWGNSGDMDYGASNTDDHTGNAGYFAWADGSSPEEAGVILETDSIDISALTVPALEFYLFSNNTDYPGDNVTLTVEYYNGNQWDTVLTYAGDNPDWVYQIIDLSSYTGAGKKVVRFTVDQTTTSSSAFYNDFAIDDISVKEFPTCFFPFNASASNMTVSGAEINWQDTSSAVGYEVIYGSKGFDPPTTGTSVLETDTFSVLTGLSPNTEYDVYLISDCGGTDGISDTVGPVKFRTLCSSFTAPYSQDFDGTTEPDLDPCWAMINTTGSTSPFLGTEGFEHYSAPNSLEMYNSSLDAADGELVVVSPEFSDLDNNKRIQFQVYDDDDGASLIIGTMTNPSDVTTFTAYDTITAGQMPDDSWQRIIVSFDAYTGSDKHIALWHGMESASNIYIDDFIYEAIPACLEPTFVSLDTIADTTATFSFVANGGTAYEYMFGPPGFNQATATIHSTTSNPFTINGLYSNFEYELYVRNNCQAGGNGNSSWTGPFGFTTECSKQSAPYFNDFESGELDVAPDCWAYYETYSSAYVETEDYNTAYSGDQTMLMYNSFGSTPSDTLLAISPQFDDITAADKQITFYAQVSNVAISLIVGTMPSPTATTDLHPLDTITFLQADNYTKYTVYLSAANGYNGTDEYIYFMHGGEVTYEYIDIDDFNYSLAPTCIPPSSASVTVDAVSINGADVSWGAGSAGYKTYINWGTPGFTPGFGNGAGMDSVAGTVDTYSITGLTSQTDYEFYIMDSCAADGLSPWIGPFSFTTACDVQNAPFIETFESSSTTADCWTNEFINGTQEWTIGSGSSGGAITSAHGGSENAVFTSSSAGGTTRFVSPLIDISALNVPFLEFYYAQEVWFSDQNELSVYVRDHNSTTWVQVFHSADDLSSWTLAEMVLPANSDTIQVAFEAIDNFGRANVIDDVSIVEGPACPDVNILSLSNLSDTSSTLKWIGNANAGSYEVWFGPQGFFQGTQTLPGDGTYTIVNGDSLELDTLMPNTCYEFAVRGICGSGDTTTWSGAYSFCTPCAAESAPYAENFDGTLEPDINSCWSVINNTTSTGYIETYDGGFPPAYSSPNLVQFYTSGSTSGDMILVTPLMEDMDASKMIRFQFYNEDLNANDLIIGTLSDPTNPATFTPYDTIFEEDIEDDQWQEVRYLFSSYTGTDKFIGLKAGMNATYDYLFIDNFRYENVTCPYPTNLQFTGNTSTSIDLSWTTGGASNWQIEYGPVGFTPGTGTIVNANSNPFTLSGLPSGKIYEVYVRDSCGAGDVSLWEGPIVANTSCSPLAGGTYTIGGASADYASFEEAAEVLNVCGIAGAVTFNIQSGTYTGNLHLRGIPGIYFGIPGASATNTITFNGSGSDTLIWDGNGPQAAVLIDSTSYVTLNNMTIINNASAEAWGVLVTNNSDYVTIDNCTILMDSTSTSSDRSAVIVSGSYEDDIQSGAEVDHFTLTNSTLVGGYYAVTLQGSDLNDLSVDYEVSNNVIREFYYYGLDLDDLEGVTVTNNTITARSNASTAADGIYAYDVNDYTIEGNYVMAPDYGLYVYDGNDGNSPSSFSTIINNMIISTGDYGIYLYDAVKTNVYHNTAVGEPAMAINDDEDLSILNNIFVSDGDYAFESWDAIDASTVIDHNLYYKSGTGDMFEIYNTTHTALTDWQSADATRNVNSVEGDPVFTSATDLHVIGGLADAAGIDTLGVSVDYDGDPRSATSPDLGADEYTPVAGDLALIEGSFIKSLCLSTNDSIELMVQNLVSPVDFSNDPLTITYNVSGPANSNGTITINTGTLGTLDTVIAYAGNIDLSIPGTYTLDAYLDSNAVNVYKTNDTLASGITLEVDSEFVAKPSVVILPSASDSTEICVESSFFSGGDLFMITEQSHYDYSVGRPSSDFPSYLVADDYIEITGVPGADLGGITLEQWEGTSIVNSYTFSSGTVLSPDGTAIIAVGQDRGSTPSPADFYYHADVSHTWGSGDNSGRVLKDANGDVIDAVGYGNYTFPASSGVTAADWSGTTGSATTTAGVRLIGPDINDGSNWVVSSASNTQDPNVVNSGVPVPAAAVSNLTWTLNGVQVDTTACIMVGPYSGPGTYVYVADFTNSCGSYTDSVTVIVPSCYAPGDLTGGAISQSSVGLSWDTTGLGGAIYEIQYGPIGFALGSGTIATSSTDSVTLTGLADNLCQEYYVRTLCSATDSSVWVGPISICPEAVTCDSLDQYAAGPVAGQSALFIPWQGAAGDAEFSTAQAASGTTSMRIYDSGPAGMSDVVAYFDTISSGAWEVEFDYYIPTGKAGYFNIQQNHAPDGVGNLWGGEIYLQANGTAQVEYGSTVAGTFSYSQSQWIDISVFIDLDNDSVWFEYNGTSTGVGYDYSLANVGAPLQFNGINFYSGVKTGDQADFYVDNFCINPFFSGACPAPTGLASNNEGCDSTEVSWNSATAGAYSLVEYGAVGFTPGTGTMVSLVQSPYVITGLTPGTAYEFYVADTCGADTSNWSGPVAFTTPSGPLPVASFVPTLNGLTVDVDASASTGATSYSWDFGNGNTATGVNATHTFATGGTHSITLTVANTCGTDDTTIVLSDIGVEENILQQSLTVYPNPAKDEVHVSFENSGSSDVVIRILDLSGKQMIEKHLETAGGAYTQTLSIDNLADGVYILEVSNGTIKGNKRLIKQ